MRLLVSAGGLFGAVGVAAAASASHLDSRNLAAIATICLAHGPALLALGLHGRGRVLPLSALVLVTGTALFAGDLGLREAFSRPMFPAAAPLGGGLMMIGWMGVAAGAWFDGIGRH